MSRKKKTSTLALGAAVAFGLVAIPAFSATAPHNPFEAQPLKSPYLAKAETKPESKPAEPAKGAETKPKAAAEKKAKDMKCGEGTCGGKSK